MSAFPRGVVSLVAVLVITGVLGVSLVGCRPGVGGPIKPPKVPPAASVGPRINLKKPIVPEPIVAPPNASHESTFSSSRAPGQYQAGRSPNSERAGKRTSDNEKNIAEEIVSEVMKEILQEYIRQQLQQSDQSRRNIPPVSPVPRFPFPLSTVQPIAPLGTDPDGTTYYLNNYGGLNAYNALGMPLFFSAMDQPTGNQHVYDAQGVQWLVIDRNGRIVWVHP